MRAELVLLGKRVDMAQRVRRRALVVAVYAALATLIAVLGYATNLRDTGIYVFWAALLVCRLFFGGYYRGGLVKPFKYQPPKNQDVPPPFLALKLRMYKPVLQTDDEEFKNDERELHQRDHAHYLAYQIFGTAVLLVGLLGSVRFIKSDLMPNPLITDKLYYILTVIAMTLYFTLPQAILLWTEPDMEPAMELAEER